MSSTNVVLLGAIAGFTIFLGLPIGRLRNLSSETRAFLNAVATGVLIFLLIEVFQHGIEPVEKALTAASRTSHGSWVHFLWLTVLFVVLFGVGLLGLVYYDRWLAARAQGRRFGPGAATAQELSRLSIARLSDPKRLALFIALGIGLHNFSEGLAIGQSAANNEIKLALLLIVGFGLHNATEGFGICAPLSGEADRPSWAFLATMGVIGGGPTFVGTIVGQAWVSETLDTAFLALAAGSILYVVVQLLNVGAKLGHKEQLMWGLLLGIVIGFGTDFVLVAAGA
jgi:zinc transporter, ZIP family